jgi:hypothetical protein
MAWVAVGMAAVGAASSIAGTRAGNKNALAQQLQINADTKASYINLGNQGKESKEVVGIALTKLERSSMKQQAQRISQTATSHTAGASALYAYTNIIQQKAFTEGTVVDKGEATLRDFGKQAEAKFNQARSGINQAQAKKKGALEASLDAFTAGASGYAAGKSL